MNVGQDGVNTNDLTILAPVWNHVTAHPSLSATGEIAESFIGNVLTRKSFVQIGAHRPDNGFTECLLDGLSDYVFLGNAIPFFTRLVIEPNPFIGRDVADRQSYIVGNQAKLPFAIRYFLLQAVVLFNIGDYNIDAGNLPGAIPVRRHRDPDAPRGMLGISGKSVVSNEFTFERAVGIPFDFSKLLVAEHFLPGSTDDFCFRPTVPFTRHLVDVQISQIAVALRQRHANVVRNRSKFALFFDQTLT